MPSQIRVGRHAQINYNPSGNHAAKQGSRKIDEKTSKEDFTYPQKSHLAAQVNHQQFDFLRT